MGENILWIQQRGNSGEGRNRTLSDGMVLDMSHHKERLSCYYPSHIRGHCQIFKPIHHTNSVLYLRPSYHIKDAPHAPRYKKSRKTLANRAPFGE